MNDKLDKINKEIKATWKRFFRSSILFIFVIVFASFLLDLKEQKYKEELDSTTWYEVVAQFDHSYHHKDRKKIDDDYEYVDYYDWYFTYVGRDGNTYNYIEKNKSFEPNEEYTTTIYVDEKDNSHSLKIESFEDGDLVIEIIIIFLILPFVIPYLLCFLILYIRKFIAKKQLH